MSQVKRQDNFIHSRDGNRLTEENISASSSTSPSKPTSNLVVGGSTELPSLVDSSRSEEPRIPVDPLANGNGDFGATSFNKARSPQASESLNAAALKTRGVPNRQPVHSSRQIPARTASDSLASTTTGDTQSRIGNMPRTSSIDSAVSSLSSSSHPQRPAIDIKEPTAEDIHNLIEAAGSPENLINHLLKEKHHTTQQNAQLWKLIDKQRALLLGLNKDLERLAKEKDRYKRKLRDVQGQTMNPSRKDSQSPIRNGGPPSTATQSNNDTVTQTPPSKQQPQFQSSPIDSAMMPQPLHFSQQQTQKVPEVLIQRSDTESSQEDSHLNMSKQLSMADPEQANAEDTQDLLPIQGHRTAAQPENPTSNLLSLQTSSLAPSLNLIEPSPMTEKSGKSFSAARKAPAPLNLKQPKGTIAILQTIHANETDQSAVEESASLTQSPPVERGRKKTREEDEKDRETALLKEQEARSRSKKEKLLKGRQDQVEQETTLTLPKFPTIGLVASPRVSPPSIQERAAAVTAQGANALLSPEIHGNISERLLAAPLRSPGLPMSPRPSDKPLGSPLPRNPKDLVAPVGALLMSPRLGTSAFPLTPRAPRSAIPLPPGSRLNNMTHASDVGTISEQEVQYNRALELGAMSPTAEAPQIYRGLMISAYPDLLLPPNALPSIEIKVASSRLRPSESNSASKPQDAPAVFSLSIFSRSDGQELWRIEKSTMALPQLDHALRPLCKDLPKVPERRLFEGHAPAVMDARRASINEYFNDLLDTPMDEKTAVIICRFLSTDTIDPHSANSLRQSPTKGLELVMRGPGGKPLKTGYLTKRGKNFGGWKSRFYILDSPELRCYESPGAQHLSTIKLLNAQIGKQSTGGSPTSEIDESDDNQYRHAFLILEPKKKDSNSLVKHVLCAESDAERDEWVEALLHYVDGSSSTGSSPPLKSGESPRINDVAINEVKGISYSDTIPGAAPKSSPASPGMVSSPTFGQNFHHDTGKGINISGPMNATVIPNGASWGNKPATQSKEQRIRSIFHFKQKPSTDSQTSNNAYGDDVAHTVTSPTRHTATQPVFGLSLAEAVKSCSPVGVDVPIPAVVYRCIEYLQAKNAASEEGLFRLSGSNLVVKMLKERFNYEGDVDFLADDQYYDVHAVASLFKTYLRELPAPVLTRELHLSFLHVTELEDRASKVTTFNSLVHRLPSVNYFLLRTLSLYLLEVVQNQDRNKMGVRNLAIVFSPTLNIPAPIITLFLTEFDAIFEREPTLDGQAGTTDIKASQSLTPEDIRSPRRQMFTDLPTPAYHQTAFSSGPLVGGLPSTPRQPNDVGFTPIPQPKGSHPAAYQHSTAHLARQPMHQQPNNEAAYGSLNHMMAPDNPRSEKAKRRESSMIFM